MMHTSIRKVITLLSAAAVMSAALLVNAQAAQPTRHHGARAGIGITARQAEGIALKKFPGKVVAKPRLENKKGVREVRCEGEVRQDSARSHGKLQNRQDRRRANYHSRKGKAGGSQTGSRQSQIGEKGSKDRINAG